MFRRLRTRGWLGLVALAGIVPDLLGDTVRIPPLIDDHGEKIVLAAALVLVASVLVTDSDSIAGQAPLPETKPEDVGPRLWAAALHESQLQAGALVPKSGRPVDLPLAPRADLIPKAWSSDLSAQAEAGHLTFDEAFRNSHGRMLVVGSPGSGKSFVAREFGTYFATSGEAETEPNSLPVYLDLGTWSSTESLPLWIYRSIGQLLGTPDASVVPELLYSARVKIALILDNLHLVGPDDFAVMVEELNILIRGMTVGPFGSLIVTCDDGVYEEVSTVLESVEIEKIYEVRPLTADQVAAEVSAFADKFRTWSNSIERIMGPEGEILREVLRSPYLLKLTEACGPNPKILLACSNADEARDAICSSFLLYCFELENPSCYPREHAIGWLSSGSYFSRSDSGDRTDWDRAISRMARLLMYPRLAILSAAAFVGFGPLFGGLVSLGALLLSPKIEVSPYLVELRRIPRRDALRSLPFLVILSALFWFASGIYFAMTATSILLVWNLTRVATPVLARTFHAEETARASLLSFSIATAEYGSAVALGFLFAFRSVPGLLVGLAAGVGLGVTIGLDRGGAYAIAYYRERRRLRSTGRYPPDGVQFFRWASNVAILKDTGFSFEFRHPAIEATVARLALSAA